MRRSLGTALAALAMAVLVGCGSDSDSSGADGGVGVAAPDTPGDPGSTPADPDRQVVTTATASVSVDDPADGAQRISELVEAAGGRVDQRTEQAGSGKDGLEGASADLVVRVPADALTGLLADLEDVGDVANVSVSRSDVTATAVDLDARISALQTSVARLEGLMNQAATTEALLAAEKALSERQERLESLQSQRAALADQVELSTLSVHLEPFGVAPAGGPDGFADGLATGWRALVAALHGGAIGLGVLLPWLGLAAVVAAAVLGTIRLVRRRSAVPTPVPAGPTQE
jgi:TolA-binding protein